MELQTDLTHPESIEHKALGLDELTPAEREIIASMSAEEIEALIGVTTRFEKAKAAGESWQMACF